MCPCTWFLGIWAQFFQISPLPKCLWNKYNSNPLWPRQYSKVSLWNKLKTLDYFSCDSVHDLGQFGHFPQISLMPTTQKTGVTRSLGGLRRRLRPNLMWNMELKTMDYFKCVPLWLGGTWDQFPQIYVMPKYPKAGTTRPTDKINIWWDVKSVVENFALIGPLIRLRSDLMWNLLLKTLY